MLVIRDKMDFKTFLIISDQAVSKEFLKRDLKNFDDAMLFVRDLTYARNPNKKDLLTVFSDNCSTCGPKHALLKLLINENNFKGFQLMLGIFKMSQENSPLVKATLEKYKLDYLPEAHNYLRYNGAMIDITKKVWNKEAIEKVIVEEREIEADQISDFKVNYHKNFLKRWIAENKIPYTLNQIWSIREQCIVDLSK